MRKSPSLRKSQRQEKRIARDGVGRVQPGSGNQPGRKGDVKLDHWLVEAKSTKGVSTTVKLSTWRKIEAEAIRDCKEPALQLDIAGRKLVVISYDAWLAMG